MHRVSFCSGSARTETTKSSGTLVPANSAPPRPQGDTETAAPWAGGEKTETNVAFIIPWRERGGRWLWEFLPPGFTGDLVSAVCKPLPPYVGEFVALARQRVEWERYDVVFTWELRCALATALLRRVSAKRRRGRFVAVGPILKGAVRRFLPLVRVLLRDADTIVCFSRAECDEYARLLRLPRERFVFLPTPWREDEAESEREGGYILALGKSNRDYATLLRAVAGTDLPVIIVAGREADLGSVALPPNVEVRYNTGHDETVDLVAGATLHCIPLHPASFSSGQSVLLRAMAQGKAVIVSDTTGIRDYVLDEETAVLVPPADSDALRTALVHLWNNPAERRRIGKQAARSVREEFGFARFTGELIEVAAELVKEKR